MNLVTGRDLDTTGSQAWPVVFCRPSTVPITARRGAPGQSMRVLLAIPCCSGEPPPRRRRRTSAREQKRNKPSPTGPHETNQTHRYRAQNATARAQQHGSELWSPVRDEEAAGSNPVTPTIATGLRPARMPRFGGLRSTPALQQTPRRNKKGTRGNPRESRGRLRQAEEHPASPHGTADPTAQQGPSGHSDPPSATKRPFGRNARRPGSSADPKSANSSGLPDMGSGPPGQRVSANDPRPGPSRSRKLRAQPMCGWMYCAPRPHRSVVEMQVPRLPASGLFSTMLRSADCRGGPGGLFGLSLPPE